MSCSPTQTHCDAGRFARAAGSAALGLFMTAAALHADTQITLQNSFIERYKDRATLDATYAVDQAQRRSGPAERGGDLRAAGRAPEIGLPAVAALMNATDQAPAANLLRRAATDGQPVALRGIWRLWCGEGGDVRQVQDHPVAPLESAAPAHVFELHPLLRVADQDLVASFRPVDDFASPDARQAFQAFESLPGRISPGNGTTTITTRMAGYDYVEFVIRLDDEPSPLIDGLAVQADVLDTAGDTLVHGRRMIAAAGTPPFLRLRSMRRGDALHVIGLPRIDLAAVSRRIADSARSSAALDWSLPYEMVLVAAYSDTPGGPDLMPGGLRRHGSGAPMPGSAPAGRDGSASAASAASDADEAPVTPSAATAGAGMGAGAAEAGSEGGSAPANRGNAASGPGGPGGGDPEVIEVMLQLLIQSLPPDAIRGACVFASGRRSYCASLSGPQCDQLGGAWNAGQDCPALDKNATPSPPPNAPPAAAQPPAAPSPADLPTTPPAEPPPGGAAADGSPSPADAAASPAPDSAPTPPPAGARAIVRE